MPRRGQVKRAGKPRSSGGCGTCRSAHTKCDEWQPVCSRCTRLGLTCEGWPSISRISTGNSAVDRLNIKSYELPFTVPGGPADRKALHYYFTHGCASLSGFGCSMDPFWEVFLPQRCNEEPVVRNALVALSCAHLEYCVGEARTSLESGKHTWHFSTATIQAHGRAIKTLKHYVGRNSVSPTVVLLCCFLLNTLSRLQNDLVAAWTHYDNGLKLLEGWQRSGRHEDLSEVLVAKFGSMAISANLKGDRAGAPTELVIRADSSSVEEKRAKRSADLNEMHAGLRAVAIGHLTQFLPEFARYRDHSVDDIPLEILDARDDIQREMNMWKYAADEYSRDHHDELERLDTKGRQQAIGYHLALAYYWIGTKLMQSALHPSARADDDANSVSPWDYNPEELFAIAETVSRLQSDLRSSKGVIMKRKWCSDWGTTGALIMLAEKTTRPEIRRRALQLVEAY